MTSDAVGEGQSESEEVAPTPDLTEERTEPDDVTTVEATDDTDPVLLVAVTEDAEDQPFDETHLEQLADAHRVEVDSALADLQRELAGMAQTGIPGVDAALARLGELDPNDLSGSSQILAEVLGQLEGVMNETPQE